eukprot:365121-Chlamydomonas_euryale.AAC.7
MVQANWQRACTCEKNKRLTVCLTHPLGCHDTLPPPTPSHGRCSLSTALRCGQSPAAASAGVPTPVHHPSEPSAHVLPVVGCSLRRCRLQLTSL